MYIGNTPQNQAYTPAVDFFSGNASTTTFTLSRPVASTYQMIVVVANVAQNPGSAYTVSGNTITFASAPPTGTNNIWVEYTSLITQVIAPSPGTVGLSQLSASGTPTTSTFLRGDNTWAQASAPGLLIRAPQILTSGTSYTTPSNCTSIYVECVGGGGGGGGGWAAGGGGGGGYVAKYFSVSGNTAYTYAIGSGGAGAGASVSNGTGGGNTTFTVSAITITASGGGGGNSGSQANAGQGSGGTSGAGSNGDLNIKGGGGSPGCQGINISGTGYGVGGIGGNSFFGGVSGGIANGTGTSGASYGGGGQGGGANSGSSGGGSGAQGIIRIWEYT